MHCNIERYHKLTKKIKLQKNIENDSTFVQIQIAHISFLHPEMEIRIQRDRNRSVQIERELEIGCERHRQISHRDRLGNKNRDKDIYIEQQKYIYKYRATDLDVYRDNYAYMCIYPAKV